jgi:hypothetical protein
VKGGQHVTKIACSLQGIEPNMYAVIGRVSEVLRKAGEEQLADEFVGRAILSDGYDEVVRLSQDYVELRKGENDESAIER